MSIEHIKSEIPLYLSGGLTESRNRQIEAHVASCDKCRAALTKARAKLARGKREALKKASSDPLPNLFLARQGKESGFDRSASNAPWLFLLLVVLAGGGYYYWHRHSAAASSVLPTSAADLEPPVVASSAPATTAAPAPTPVAAPAPAPVHAELPKPPTIFSVQQEWKGPECGIKTPRLVVIRTDDAWRALWTEMQQGEPLPEINFNEHVVMGIFAGDHPTGSSIAFGKIKEREDDIYAPYFIIAPDAQASTAAAPSVSHPYLLALISHTDKKIRLVQKEASQ